MRRTLLGLSHFAVVVALLLPIAADATEAHKRIGSGAVKGSIGGEAHDGYVIRVQKGQRLSVRLSWVPADDNSADFSISESSDFFSADPVSFGAASDDGRSWSGTVPATKDYYLYVVAHPLADYTLDVKVGSPTPTDLVRDAIEAQNRKFANAFPQGDAEAIGRLYTSDAKVIPPDAEIASGREAIAAFWKGVMATAKSVSLRTAEVQTAGELAYEYGTAELKSPQAEETVRYIVVWKRSKGEWQLHRDIWNPGPKSAGGK